MTDPQVETATQRAGRYQAAANRCRPHNPDAATRLDQMAATAREAAQHEGHAVTYTLGGIWCSCGKPLGIYHYVPDEPDGNGADD